MPTHEERFTALYRRHYDDIDRYVRRRASDLAVRDVVAEVFLVAWRRPREVPWSNPLPWLYGVARRVLANEVRSAQRARSLVERAREHAVSTVGDHGDAVADRLTVAAAFDSLSEADREALRLIAWEGLSVRDAARAAGCSLPAMSMRLSRARRRLKAALSTVPVSSALPALGVQL
jgi:RNA polymerase sigma-70 factor (ECF subfamily)